MKRFFYSLRLRAAELLLPRTHTTVRVHWSNPSYLTLSPGEYRWVE